MTVNIYETLIICCAEYLNHCTKTTLTVTHNMMVFVIQLNWHLNLGHSQKFRNVNLCILGECEKKQWKSLASHFSGTFLFIFYWNESHEEKKKQVKPKSYFDLSILNKYSFLWNQAKSWFDPIPKSIGRFQHKSTNKHAFQQYRFVLSFGIDFDGENL